MRSLILMAAFLMSATGVVSSAHAQDRDDPKQLRAEIDTLRKQVLILEKENELLRREIELMKRETSAKPGPDADPKGGDKPRTKARELGSVEYELVRCARNPRERGRVTFTFAVRDEKGNVQTVHGCKDLTLTSGDGEVVDGRVVSVSKEMVMLTKGEWSRFQVTYDGVGPEITTFDEVELTMGAPLGFPRAPLKFHRIQIEPK